MYIHRYIKEWYTFVCFRPTVVLCLPAYSSRAFAACDSRMSRAPGSNPEDHPPWPRVPEADERTGPNTGY